MYLAPGHGKLLGPRPSRSLTTGKAPPSGLILLLQTFIASNPLSLCPRWEKLAYSEYLRVKEEAVSVPAGERHYHLLETDLEQVPELAPFFPQLEAVPLRSEIQIRDPGEPSGVRMGEPVNETDIRDLLSYFGMRVGGDSQSVHVSLFRLQQHISHLQSSTSLASFFATCHHPPQSNAYSVYGACLCWRRR